MPVRILARNLSKATQYALGGVTDVYLDTPEDFRLPFSKDVEKLSNLNQIKVEGALRASLDYSDVNNAVLVDYYTPLTIDNRRKWVDVTVTVDGIPTLFSRLYVIAKNDDSGKWEIECALPADHWVELASAKLINDIDYGAFTLTKTNIETAWAYQGYNGDYTPTQDEDGWNGAYGWWPVDYGDWVDRSIPAQNTTEPVKMLAVEDLRPFVNAGYLLIRGFCEIGWTLGGPILETLWSRSQWDYLLREEYYNAKGYDGIQYGKYCRIIGRILDADLTFGATLADRYIYFTALDYSFGSGAELQFQGDPSKWVCGLQNPLPFRSKFKLSFKFQLEAHPVVVIAQTFTFNIQEIDPDDTDNDTFTGTILSNDQSFSIDVGETKWLAFDFEIELDPGQKCGLSWLASIGSFAGIIKKGAWFRCEPNNQALTREDEVDLRTCLRDDLYLLDMLKAYVNKINGRIETDYITKTVTLHPERTTDVYGEFVPGFVREDLEAEQVNVLPSSVKLQFVRPELKRYTQLSWQDTNDSYIDTLVLTEPLHSRKILNGEDLVNETDEIQNPVFEPTAEGQTALLKRQTAVTTAGGTRAIPSPYFPRMWDNTDGERSFDIGPRTLIAFGEIRQINANYLDGGDQYAAFFWDEYDNLIIRYGYATQLRTWNLHKTADEEAPDQDFNLVFGRAANDIFVLHYIGLTNDNRGGIVIDLLEMMTMAEYSRCNFRRFYTFDYQGRQLRLPRTAIRDFVPGIPTPVTYFASPVETGCCDLPCSCRFTTCDYYQDFGTYIRQSTMDGLTITSFKIDNIEILTAPVSLGQINIVDLAGGAYVTNLVDALNSIEAPYFFFDYSTRQHAAKGLRFFTIKRPTCQTFEIIISDAGDPVYKYTDSSQLEQWFGGSYGAIGYPPETFTATDNCSITVEY